MTSPTTILCVSSHVVAGAVGNRIAVAELQRAGHQVLSLPTILLNWHPGQIARYGPIHKTIPPLADFSAFLDSFLATTKTMTINAVLSGYLGEAGQAEHLADTILQLKAQNPDLVYLCDPVIGDAAGLYVPDAIANAIRDRLLPLADWITPNRFELAWLTGETGLVDNAAIERAARILPARNAVITSAFGGSGEIANLLVEGEKPGRLVAHAAYDAPPSGTGDLLASAFLGSLLSGDRPIDALNHASETVRARVADAAKRNATDLSLALETGTP